MSYLIILEKGGDTMVTEPVTLRGRFRYAFLFIFSIQNYVTEMDFQFWKISFWHKLRHQMTKLWEHFFCFHFKKKGFPVNNRLCQWPTHIPHFHFNRNPNSAQTPTLLAPSWPSTHTRTHTLLLYFQCNNLNYFRLLPLLKIYIY